jgi:hypothetical protein
MKGVISFENNENRKVIDPTSNETLPVLNHREE